MKGALRNFIQWLRQALPIGRAVWRIPLLYGLPAVYVIFAFLHHAIPSVAVEMRDDVFHLLPHHFILLFYAAIYGLYCAAHRHPIHDAAFRNWLRIVPWTPAKPLPFRLDGLSAQALLIVGLLMALGRDGSSVAPWWVLSEFLFFYTLATLWTLARMKAWRTVYGLIWAASFLLLLIFHPPALAMGLAALAAAAMLAERRARHRHRWHAPEPIPCQGLDAARMTLGLPTDYEKGLASVIGRTWFGLAVGLLAGWWVYLAARMGAGSSFVYDGGAPMAFLLFAGIILTVIRMIFYFSFAAPPLSIPGRLATGRLIIPGYDQIILAPLAMGAAFIGTGRALYYPPWGLSNAAVLALGTAAVLAGVLGVGPTLRRWALTGQYRTRMGARVMLNPFAPSGSTSQNILRRLAGAQRRAKLRERPAQIHPEPFLLLSLPWPGSRDRHARMITWLTLATVAAFAVVISLTLLPGRDWFFLIKLPCLAFLTLLFIIYSVSRAFLFHPVFRPHYRAWLKTTPWRPGMALPLGPPGLVWRDGLYLGVYLALMGAFLALLIWQARIVDPRYGPSYRWAFVGPGYAAFGFLMAYGYGKLRLFFSLGECGPAFMLGALLGAVALLLPHPAWALLCAAVALAVCAWGDQRALRRFPWEDGEEGKPGELPAAIQTGKLSLLLSNAGEAKIGWLNAALSPRPALPSFCRWERLALILLPAWWIFALVQTFSHIVPSGHATPQQPRPDNAVGLMVYLLPTFFALVQRLSLYFRYARPPVSLLGRIGAGRLIIPGFDRVFVTPLAVLVSIIAQTALIIRTGARGEWFAAAWAVSWSLVLLGGPSLRNWRLTAECRLTMEPPVGEKGIGGR